MLGPRSLVPPTGNPLLERALRDKLVKRSRDVGSLGELEPLAMRIGLMQNSLKPRLHDPHLIVVASDHGLAVDLDAVKPGHTTADEVQRILSLRMPMSVFALNQGMDLMVVDAGIADRVASHDRLLVRKIAHGTRNARVGSAMSVEQVQAAMRAGMEIAHALPGNVVACAGLGVGSSLSATTVLACLTDRPPRDFLVSGAQMDATALRRLEGIAQTSLARHRELDDPIDILAAMGGFEMAMMAGLMLTCAQLRHLIIVDGLAACASLMIASHIAPAVTDYVVFARSSHHEGIDHALALFQAGAVLELNMDSADGTGAALAWPLIRSSAALLTELMEGEDPGPTQPSSGFIELDETSPPHQVDVDLPPVNEIRSVSTDIPVE